MYASKVDPEWAEELSQPDTDAENLAESLAGVGGAGEGVVPRRSWLGVICSGETLEAGAHSLHSTGGLPHFFWPQALHKLTGASGIHQTALVVLVLFGCGFCHQRYLLNHLNAAYTCKQPRIRLGHCNLTAAPAVHAKQDTSTASA